VLDADVPAAVSTQPAKAIFTPVAAVSGEPDLGHGRHSGAPFAQIIGSDVDLSADMPLLAQSGAWHPDIVDFPGLRAVL
jgi:hypothetical protein